MPCVCVDQACHYYHKLSICVITVSKCFWNRFEVSKRFQIIRFELSTPPLWNFKPPKRQDFKAKCETSNNYFEVSKGWLWSFKGNCFEVSKFGVWIFKAIYLKSHWNFKSISKPCQSNDNTYWERMTVLACLINKNKPYQVATMGRTSHATGFGAKRLCLAPAACTVASCRRECVGPCGWLLFSAPVLKQQITKQKSREFPSPELVKKNRYTSRFGKVFNICIQTYRQTKHNMHTYIHTYIPA